MFKNYRKPNIKLNDYDNFSGDYFFNNLNNSNNKDNNTFKFNNSYNKNFLNYNNYIKYYFLMLDNSPISINNYIKHNDIYICFNDIDLYKNIITNLTCNLRDISFVNKLMESDYCKNTINYLILYLITIYTTYYNKIILLYETNNPDIIGNNNKTHKSNIYYKLNSNKKLNTNNSTSNIFYNYIDLKNFDNRSIKKNFASILYDMFLSIGIIISDLIITLINSNLIEYTSYNNVNSFYYIKLITDLLENNLYTDNINCYKTNNLNNDFIKNNLNILNYENLNLKLEVKNKFNEFLNLLENSIVKYRYFQNNKLKVLCNKFLIKQKEYVNLNFCIDNFYNTRGYMILDFNGNISKLI